MTKLESKREKLIMRNREDIRTTLQNKNPIQKTLEQKSKRH